MKFSIVIPAHNEEQYLSKTLAAVKALEYRNFEIIVVDNASSDGTVRAAHAVSGVKVVEEHRKGSQWARERGRQEATGDAIAFIDADCLPDKDWLSKCAAVLATGAVAVTGPYYYYDYNNLFGKAGLFLQKTFYWFIHQIFQKLGWGGTMVLGNTAVTKEALEKIGGLDTSFTFYGDDTDLVKKLTAIGRVVYDRKLIMKTSARRFKNIGTFKTMTLYFSHYIWVMFIKDHIASKPTNE